MLNATSSTEIVTASEDRKVLVAASSGAVRTAPWFVIRQTLSGHTFLYASSMFKIPITFVSHVLYGISKLIFTWLWAAKLYISSGLLLIIAFMIDDMSVRSP